MPTVLLAGEDATSRDILRETEQTLATFAVPTLRVPEGLAGAAGAEWLATVAVTVYAVIVAAKNGALPEFWARATARPTLRVPFGAGDDPPLELLQDGRGQLPAGAEGAEFATMAIGAAGARNAALFVVSGLSLTDATLRERWLAFRTRQTATVLEGPVLELED